MYAAPSQGVLRSMLQLFRHLRLRSDEDADCDETLMWTGDLAVAIALE